VPRTRGRLWLLALIVALVLADTTIVATQSGPTRRVADFTIGYSAATLLREGRWNAIYDQQQLGARMVSLAGGAPVDPRLPFNEPPAALIPFLALSLLSLDAAFRVWQLVSLALLAAAILVLRQALPLGRWAGGVAFAAVLASLPAVLTLTEGQLTAVLVLGAAFLVRSALHGGTISAALGIGLLAIKPQYVAFYVAVLIAARQWKSVTVAVAAASAVALGAFQMGLLVPMIRQMSRANVVSPLHTNVSWIGSFAMLPEGLAGALALVLFFVAVLGILVAAWRFRGDLRAFTCLATSLCVVAVPHALAHDVLLLLIPAWLAFHLHRQGHLSSPVPALLIVEGGLLVDRASSLPAITPVLITGLVCWYGWDFTRRRIEKRDYFLTVASR